MYSDLFDQCLTNIICPTETDFKQEFYFARIVDAAKEWELQCKRELSLQTNWLETLSTPPLCFALQCTAAIWCPSELPLLCYEVPLKSCVQWVCCVMFKIKVENSTSLLPTADLFKTPGHCLGLREVDSWTNQMLNNPRNVAWNNISYFLEYFHSWWADFMY